MIIKELLQMRANLLSESQIGSMDIHGLENLVQKTIEADPKSDFIIKSNCKLNNSNFGGSDTCTIIVGYVDSRTGHEEDHQNTSKKLNAIISPLMHDFKTAGLTFTQPKGVQGKYSENDQFRMGELEFTIGTSGK